VDALNDELMVRYGGGEPSVAHPEQFRPPYGGFFVLTVDGVDVACGGVRRLTDEVGEVKRMYVDPAARGKGLSRVVLGGLVDFARSVGYRELWLETGVRQPEAMALYESSGFAPIERYGQYKDDPRARCYALTL
jgi:GNAT superfamily N-acetyltransferase